jgi:cytochrome P450
MVDPQKLLSQFDQYDPAHIQVMHEVFAHARRECPVFRTSAEPGYWVVSRFADAKAILLDTTTFSNRDGVTIHGVGEPRPLPAASDPPLHKQYRNLLRPLFTQQHIRRFEPHVRELARQFMEPWLHTGKVEFVHDYAAKLAYASLFAVFLQSAGARNIAVFVEGADRVVQESTQQAYAHLMDLVRELLEQRRSSGQHTDDLISAVEAGTVDGRPLSGDEKIGMVFSAVAAGFETNYATMALIMHQVAQRPELEDRIRGADWAAENLDEFLCLVSPVTGLIRTVTADTEVNGVSFKAGDKVLIHYASAGRDEAQFPDPDSLNFSRANSGQHMAFSFGVHRCLGAPFAELLIGVGPEELSIPVDEEFQAAAASSSSVAVGDVVFASGA